MRGVSGALQQVLKSFVSVTGPDFTLAFTQPTVSGTRGAAVKATLAINRIGNFGGNVDITPSDTSGIGVKVKPPSISAAGNSVTFKFKIKGGAEVGSHAITFTGRDPTGRERQATITLVIQ